MAKRRVTVLLAVLGLVLAAMTQAPSARAAETVTAVASATSVTEGSTVGIRGAGTPGSLVALQRWWADGWHTVARKTLDGSRRFSFRVTPPRGQQRYRVREPAQAGRPAATSPAVAITVKWRPQVTATASVFLRSDRQWVTRVAGNAAAYAILDVQHWDSTNGTWTSAGGGTIADAAGHYRVDIAGHPAGWRFRIVSTATSVRLPGYSAVLSAVQRPIPLPMNRQTAIGALVADPATGDATLTLPATAGDLVSVAIDKDARASAMSVTLNGAPVPISEPYQQQVTTFRAPETGTYRLTSYVYDGVSDPVTIWTSTAKTTAYDGFCCSADQDRPGQILDFSVPAAADDMFVFTPWGGPGPALSTTLLDPSGSAVPPLYSELTSYGTAQVYRVTTAGTQILRYLAHELDPLMVRDYLQPVDTKDVTLDGGPVTGGATATGSAGRFRLIVPAGTTFIAHSGGSGQLLTPSGERLGVLARSDTCVADSEGGEYDMIVWSPNVGFSADTASRCPH